MSAMSGRQIYDNFLEGNSSELHGCAEMATVVASVYTERAGDFQRLIAKMGTAWQGDAFGAAQFGARQLVAEHEHASLVLTVSEDLTSRQAASFDQARNSVVPVPAEPGIPSFGDVVSGLPTYRAQLDSYRTANQQNVDVMSRYAHASSYNATWMPQSYGTLINDQAVVSVAPPAAATGGIRAQGTASPMATRSSTPAPAGNQSMVEGTAPSQATAGSYPVSPGGLSESETGGVRSAGTPSGGGGPGTGSGAGPIPGGRAGVRGRSGGAGPGPEGPGGRRSGVGRPIGGGVLGGPGDDVHRSGGRGSLTPAAGRAASPMGGFPQPALGRGPGEEDSERFAPEYLREPDPEGLFDTDEVTAPAVIGEQFEPLRMPLPRPDGR